MAGKKPTGKKADSGARRDTGGKKGDFESATGSRAEVLQRHLINEVARTLWLPEGLSEEDRMSRLASAIALLEGIRPEGEIEGMLAAQMVATHNAAMECLRRTMIPEQPLAGREHNLKHAAKLLALYARQLEVLDKHRGKGQQKVTVEHVHVEAGGQAIVGNVEETGRRRRKKRPAPALEHNPEVPCETSAPAIATTRRKG